MRRSHAPLLVLALAAPWSIACRPAPAPPSAAGAGDGAAPAPLSAADEAAIRSADATFEAMANAGDPGGVAGVYAADASLLPPNAPAVKGAAGVKEYWGGFFAAYDAEFGLEAEQIDGRGDLAYVVGSYTLTAKPKAKGPPAFEDKGKFVEVLKRQADGSWKYAVDIYNSDLPVK
ncbi:MAG TPA: DUF4440 domain-containing protein [Gemmatimonadales bacterium]|nr:DUF4440 domain-containing protein [Gemmatimonadales bacterium]